MSKFLKLLGALGLVVGLAVPANAGLVLIIDEGNDGTDVTCVDNDGACDDNPDVGEISFNGSIGDWDLDIISAESDEYGLLSELQSTWNIDYEGAGTGVLKLIVYDDMYSSPAGAGTAVTEIDGTDIGSAVTVDACSAIDATNIACDSDLGQGEELTGSIDYSTTPDFELSQTLIFTATASGDAGESQLDATTSFSVPEPAVLGLLGLGLIGVGVARRRRKAAA